MCVLAGKEAVLEAEFASVPLNNARKDSIAPEQRSKNRYSNVLPNTHSRVPLLIPPGAPATDKYENKVKRGQLKGAL